MSGAHARRGTFFPGRRAVGWAVAALAVAALVGFVTVGANGPADPTLGGIPGFGEVAFRVVPPPAGASGQFCALLAETEAQHAQGLMGRTDLAGYDAMVFRFPQDTASPFYMRNVPVPLSIAWFDADGRFVAATDMEPCGDEAGCPLYPPPRAFRVAIEVPKGGLGALGVGPDARIEVGGACPR